MCGLSKCRCGCVSGRGRECACVHPLCQSADKSRLTDLSLPPLSHPLSDPGPKLWERCAERLCPPLVRRRGSFFLPRLCVYVLNHMYVPAVVAPASVCVCVCVRACVRVCAPRVTRGLHYSLTTLTYVPAVVAPASPPLCLTTTPSLYLSTSLPLHLSTSPPLQPSTWPR